MGSAEKRVDVLIIGAGMAGGCLARQLRLQHPQLKIAIIERKTSFDYWVGESTLCSWTEYAFKHLRLGPYLVQNHLPKFGLRFFFDSAKKDLSLPEMSEDGRTVFPPLPSFQIDRSRFDRDLCEINRKDGVDVHLGCRLLGRESDASQDYIKIDADRGHTVHTTDGVFRCRWLIDASGRASPLARMFDLVEDDERHPVSSLWGRFEGCRSIDEFGDEEWRARVHYHPRQLSTNHFMYRGYWFWHIPITKDVVSIGVCIHPELSGRTLRGRDEFQAFLKEHRWARDVVGDSGRMIDFFSMKKMNRCAKQIFSTDRWFLTGMSAVFVDPMNSTSSNLFSYNNRFIGELIGADLAGDSKRVARLAKHFDLFMRLRYEATIARVDYRRFGSLDLFQGFYAAGQDSHFNTVVPTSSEDFKTYLRTLDRHGETCACTFEGEARKLLTKGLFGASMRITDEFRALLEAKNAFYGRNRGEFVNGRERPQITEKYLRQPTVEPRDLGREHDEDLETYRELLLYYVRRAAELEGIRFDDAAFDRWFDPDWDSGQTIAQGLAALQKRARPRQNGHPRKKVKPPARRGSMLGGGTG